jgi:5-oxoprolinase (ATP-hydrolysing)
LEVALNTLGEAVVALAANARTALLAQDVPLERIETVASAEIRYEGIDATLTVPFGSGVEMQADFEAEHRRRFGFIPEHKNLVIETLSVEAVGVSRTRAQPPPVSGASPSLSMIHVRARMAGKERDTPVYDREALTRGAVVDGPAIIKETTATTVVEPGWRASVDARSNLILERISPLPSLAAVSTDVNPIMLEVFNNLFMAVAEEMGLALQNTASSVNIKERLDFSCALFDRDGALIANAPHIPVHLGSMGDSVRMIIDSRGCGRDGRGIFPGDAYVLNAPYHGGTHLPDVTVIMPAFDEAGELIAYIAARGHQADIGGMTPGSMPPFSKRVEDEGVLIDDFLLVDQGRFREQETRALLASGVYPARNPGQNIADLKAQIAACV